MRKAVVCATVLFLAGCIPAEVLSVRTAPLGDGFTFLEGGGGNTVVLVRGQTAFVFDPKLWPWDYNVERVVTDANVATIYVVDSHLHGDHTGGNVLFPSATIFAAPDVVTEFRRDAETSPTPTTAGLPSVAIRSHLSLSVAGEPVLLVHQAPAHTSGDVYAWFPLSRTLVTGDLFDNGYYPHVDAAHGGTYLGYLSSLERLSEYPANVVIPGHGPKATRADLVSTRDFLRDIRASVVSARRAGLSDDEILERLSAPASEKLTNLGPFSSRAAVVRGFLRELAAQ